VRHDIQVRTGVCVERIERRGREWLVRAATGGFVAPQVIVATGFARVPHIPPWPGRDAFDGRLLHSAEYRTAEAFEGADVLVVGSGSSGMEIAFDLAEGGARRVRLSVRTPPNILLRSVAGVPGDPLAVVLRMLPARIADAPRPCDEASDARGPDRAWAAGRRPTGRSRDCSAVASLQPWSIAT
jgi:cation diffusion facilitator CzcD-associated flavoprotein CzcO